MAALLVAFGSSAKRHTSQEENLLLHRQVEQLDQANRRLEEKLRWVEDRFAQARSLGKRLNEALLEEQAKNRRLAEQFYQHP